MQQNQNNYDYLIKVVTIGSHGVGKTKLTHRFHTNAFCETCFCTIGIDFYIRTLNVHENKVKFQVWDLCGAERFRPVTRSYYRGALGITMVFDITDRNSFTGLAPFCQEILQGASENATIIVVGTKADLEDQRVVSTDEAQEFADEHGFLYIETSAKTGMNVDNLYMVIAKQTIEKIKVKENNKESENFTKSKHPSENSSKRLFCIG